MILIFFFFNDTATTEIYTLSLHDALPIYNVGQSNYNALQASLQQRLSAGLTYNVNYTFSKALGTINGGRSAYLQEKALSLTDLPHVFNAFFSYQLPFGKGRMFNTENKIARSLVSGWQISGITR